jgi:hypothetical protein
MGDGESADEAMHDVKVAFGAFLDTALQQGIEIKEPSHLTRAKRINITVPSTPSKRSTATPNRTDSTAAHFSWRVR